MAWNKFRTNKYGSTKVNLDGYSFASKLEASVYGILKLRMRAGEIIHIQAQDHVLISGWYTYIPDFKCTSTDGSFFWVEAKGFQGNRWPSTKKGWKHAGPGKLEIWTGSHTNPKLSETIIPIVNNS